MNMLRTLIVISCVGLVACGNDPTDRPQDCSANEFFDETRTLCQSCPALIIPSCREGCGITILEDERGCPAAACNLSCDSCPEGSAFSLETLSCEPLCPEGSSIHPLTGACSECLVNDSMPLDCDDLSCSCSLIVTLDAKDCPVSSCAACTDPQDNFAISDEGMCVAAP